MQRLATFAARAAIAFRSEGPAPRKDSRPSVSKGNVPTLKRVEKLTATEGDEKALLVSLLPFRSLTVWSLLAQLWPGEGAPSLFPPPLRFAGPGAPPATAAEVAQTFRQSLQKNHKQCFRCFVSMIFSINCSAEQKNGKTPEEYSVDWHSENLLLLAANSICPDRFEEPPTGRKFIEHPG
jgi:hypothetical protein